MRLILLIVLMMVGVQTQAQVTIEEFLNSAFEEPLLKSFDAQHDFLNDKKAYRLPPIQKLELRTESNQLDRTRQDYGLRINPANPFEIKRTNQYFKSYQELLQLDRERTLKELLFARYEVIIGWVYYQEIRDLKEEDKKITEKLVAILEGQRYSGFFDAEDYLELKMEQVDKAIELEETFFEIDNQKRKVDALYQTARLKKITWPVSEIISLERLEKVVDSIFSGEARAGEVAYREKQIDLAAREWQLEKANINVGFIQRNTSNGDRNKTAGPGASVLVLTFRFLIPTKAIWLNVNLICLKQKVSLPPPKIINMLGWK